MFGIGVAASQCGIGSAKKRRGVKAKKRRRRLAGMAALAAGGEEMREERKQRKRKSAREGNEYLLKKANLSIIGVTAWRKLKRKAAAGANVSQRKNIET